MIRVTVSVKNTEHQKCNKEPIHAKALQAYCEGKLKKLERKPTVRLESTYEQDQLSWL